MEEGECVLDDDGGDYAMVSEHKESPEEQALTLGCGLCLHEEGDGDAAEGGGSREWGGQGGGLCKVKLAGSGLREFS